MQMIKNNEDELNKKVVVAMSGGVDSSVAAALLKKQGFDVVGVFMRFWKETRNLTDRNTEFNRNTCCSEGAEQAARDVAAKLKIPFYIFNFQKEFKKAVVDYFLRETAAGRTPNPCVVCNKKIKFGLMFKKALAMGADFVATGHYARLLREIRNPKSENRNKSQIQNSKLFQARDKEKDQTYFLYNLTQKQLSRVLFPVGDYKKEEVYKMAKRWRLPFRRGESFDLCFVARNVESFLKKYLKMKPGKIVKYNLCHSGLDPESRLDSRFRSPCRSLRRSAGGNDKLNDGKILGEHRGLAFYTTGQRKSIPLGHGPWWVVKKDQKKNILYVSNNEKDLYSREAGVTGLGWLNGESMRLPAKVWAKIRYKSEAAEALIYQKQKNKNQKQIRIKFNKPQRAITPGQSAVFYGKGGELLGGGVIK